MMGKVSASTAGRNNTSSNYLMEPIENLKAFATGRPPLIVFMTCLGVFALILMTLAFYVKDAELKKPDDISQDWSVFLANFSALEFCIDNSTFPTTTRPLVKDPIPAVQDLTTDTIELTSRPSLPRSTVYKNYSITMMLSIQPTVDFVQIPQNLTTLTGFVYGAELGLQGIAGKERINIAMQLPFEWNTTKCSSGSVRQTGACNVVHIYTCVYFQAAEHVFPASKRPTSCETLNDTGVEYHASIIARKPAHRTAGHECRSRTQIKIDYKLDQKLTVLLSLSDRSVINLHLLHTSYFLFVMTITLLLHATIRGRPVKFKTPFSSSLSSSTTEI